MQVQFENFPRLDRGKEDEGAEVYADGKVVGFIVREVDWRDVLGTLREQRPVILGYQVHMDVDDGEVTFDTLGDARAYARERLVHASRRETFVALRKTRPGI